MVIEMDNVVHLVTSATQAGRLLLESWPGAQTSLRRSARFACVAALENGDNELCRTLFVEAAREAHILRND